MSAAKLDNFYRGKKVFITGHTGFKGSWLSSILLQLGADVYGYSHKNNDKQSLFLSANLAERLNENIFSDIRDKPRLRDAVLSIRPDIVFHLAAQPIVQVGYQDPADTFDVNIMGSISLLEAIRSVDYPLALVYITSDKCYKNNEWLWGYRENDVLGGDDPYSASKACAELVFHSYQTSFFSNLKHLKLGSARAGNVIGGGDKTAVRLVPELIQTIESGNSPIVRNPTSTRPWQHVLEPLRGYLLLGMYLYQDNVASGEAWNFGPSPDQCLTVGDVSQIIAREMGGSISMATHNTSTNSIKECGLLQLSSEKANTILGWKPWLTQEDSIFLTTEWHKARIQNKNMGLFTDSQISHYFSNHD